MKRSTALIAGLCAGVVALLATSCAGAPAAVVAEAAPAPGSDQILPFVHIDGFGTPDDSFAWIAWEFEAQAYVKYQIAFTSCTCRPESINERSLLYVEIAKSETGGKIRKIYYEYWGDSPQMPSGVKRAEIEEGFVPLLVNKKLDTLDSVDVMTGATVTTVNLKQIAAAVLAYHNAKYPAVGIPEPEDYVDTTTGATKQE